MPNYRTVTSVGEVREYLSGNIIAVFDFETAPDEQWRDDEKAALDPNKSHIVGISFSVAEGSAIYVPLTHKIGANIDNSVELWAFLAEWFINPIVMKVAHTDAGTANLPRSKPAAAITPAARMSL